LTDKIDQLYSIVYDVTKYMEIRVFDKDTVKDNFLGVVSIPLHTICQSSDGTDDDEEEEGNGQQSRREQIEPIKLLKKYQNGGEKDAATIKFQFRWEPYETNKELLENEAWIEDSANQNTLINSPSNSSHDIVGDLEEAASSSSSSPTVIDNIKGGAFGLGVKIVEGQDLVKRGLNGPADPCCIIECDQFPSHSTKIVRKSANPIWNESFAFQIYHPEGRIKFKVFDWNRFTQCK
jgi:hypothetical protein